ncbi:MAG: ATP-binding protein [Cyanobacteria bacterium P01_F01_bin.33]
MEQFVYELVSNVLDLYLVSQATRVEVKLDGSNISVIDDGPGLPFDEPSELEDISLATKFFTHPHQTRSRDNHAPHVHMDSMLTGVGLAILNIASAQMTVQSWRSGSLWKQHFAKGISLSPAIAIERGSGRGTQIDLTLDSEIFGDFRPRHDVLRKTLFEASHLFSGLKIGFNEEVFCCLGGLKALGLMMNGLLWPFPLFSIGHAPFHVSLCLDKISLEVAMFGNSETSSHVFSWANGARTPERGSHVSGLFQVLRAVRWTPALCLMHVVMHEPEFAGPMCTKLHAPHIRQIIYDALFDPIREYKAQIDEPRF